MTFTEFLATGFVVGFWTICFTLAVNGIFRIFYYAFDGDSRLKVGYKTDD